MTPVSASKRRQILRELCPHVHRTIIGLSNGGSVTQCIACGAATDTTTARFGIPLPKTSHAEDDVLVKAPNGNYATISKDGRVYKLHFEGRVRWDNADEIREDAERIATTGTLPAKVPGWA